MSFTIKDALSMDALKGAKLIGGAGGVDNIISCIDILETPDSYAWVRPNELAITTGYSIKDDTAWQIRLLRSLARVGGAGLGIKFGRYIGHIDENLIDVADKLNMPLISFPDEIPYIDITHPLMSRIVNDQADLLAYSDKVYRKLTFVALESNSTEMIAQTLAEILNRPVKIRTFMENYFNSRDLMNYQCFSVKVRNKTYGFIYIESTRELTELDMIAVEHARVLVALQLMHYELASESGWNERRDLLDDLLSGRLPALPLLKARADVFGFSLDTPRAVCLVDIDGFSKFILDNNLEESVILELRRRFLKSVQQLVLRLSSYDRDFLTVQKSDRIIILLDPKKVNWDKLSLGIQDCLNELNSRLTATVVMTEIVDNVNKISIIYDLAIHLLRIARSVKGPGSTLHQRDAEVYLMLEKLKDNNLVETVLGKLLKSKNSEEYIRTLNSYIRHQGNLTEISKELYIHRNTLRYRLQKIEGLLGKQLDNAEDRAILWLVLRTLDMQ